MDKNLNLADETINIVHQLQLRVLKMWNMKKRHLTEQEFNKMMLIQETVENLLLELEDGAFEHLTKFSTSVCNI